jgi:DNA-directed RNA polymerase subunit F
MIKTTKPLSMAEATEYLNSKEDREAVVLSFINKFSKIKYKDAKELREKLEEMDMIKMKPTYVVKILDLMPENEEELNKIFTDVSLDEDETKKILETIKEFR